MRWERTQKFEKLQEIAPKVDKAWENVKELWEWKVKKLCLKSTNNVKERKRFLIDFFSVQIFFCCLKTTTVKSVAIWNGDWVAGEG